MISLDADTSSGLKLLPFFWVSPSSNDEESAAKFDLSTGDVSLAEKLFTSDSLLAATSVCGGIETGTVLTVECGIPLSVEKTAAGVEL
jgi:hypothetical protein